MSEVTWSDIRSHWVNGNRSDAREQLVVAARFGDGYGTLRIILEALDADMKTRTGTHTGDIIDLREIIRSLL